MDIFSVFNGYTIMVGHGMFIPVPMLLKVDIWNVSNTPVPMDVHGIIIQPLVLLKMGICMYWNGLQPWIAPWTLWFSRRLLKMAMLHVLNLL